jgi:hypothetical protein
MLTSSGERVARQEVFSEMGPRAGLEGCGKSHPHQDYIPGLSSL